MLQLDLSYDLLTVEDARAEASSLVEALQSESLEIRLQAVRALGRFERAELAPNVAPFLGADESALRIEAANALAQMKASSSPLLARLELEQDAAVRGAIYEALGRLPGTSQEVLGRGLEESPETVKLGAVKGLEALLRTEQVAPSASSLEALRSVIAASSSAKIRQLALLALNRAQDRHVETLELAWRDKDPLVRRLAILGLEEWRDDPSPLVQRFTGSVI